jgi:hypothetical protein
LESFFTQIEQWQTKNTLLYVSYTKSKIGRMTFSGRVVHLSPDRQQFLFYNDDTKSVFILEINEIDDVIPYKNR